MAYELLLIQDVESLGRKGQIIRARPGYARNFLLPKQLAVVASPHTLRTQKRLQDERDKQAKVDRQESEETAGKLGELTLSITVKVDQEGHMYGSVGSSDIVELLKAQGFEIEKKNVLLRAPLKTTGLHQVPLKLKEGVSISVALAIEPEGHMRKEAPAA